MTLLDRFPFRLLAACLAACAAALLAGCSPEIGDKCILSTDCSTRGDRLCDTSQPGGYCTQFNCAKNGCPNDAACVLFNAAVPGCGYDDRAGQYGSRVARSFCVARCEESTDCRAGYVCSDPTNAPWNGLVQDDDKSKRTCLVAPTVGTDTGVDSPKPAPVCASVAPDAGAIDASAANVDQGVPPTLPADGGTDAAPPRDGGADAGAGDAGDAGAGDAGDAGDGG